MLRLRDCPHAQGQPNPAKLAQPRLTDTPTFNTQTLDRIKNNNCSRLKKTNLMVFSFVQWGHT